LTKFATGQALDREIDGIAEQMLARVSTTLYARVIWSPC
jgi:hypothetical protein